MLVNKKYKICLIKSVKITYIFVNPFQELLFLSLPIDINYIATYFLIYA